MLIPSEHGMLDAGIALIANLFRRNAVVTEHSTVLVSSAPRTTILAQKI